MGVSFTFTDRDHGDLAVDGDVDALQLRRAALVDAPWTWLTQVHGGRVVTVRAPGEHAGVEADAAVTDVPGAPIAIHTADCAPVVLLADGAVGVVHAGWRGLLAGVIEATAEALEALGHRPRTAVLGPCIRPSCYEFGATDLHRMVGAFGPGVRATTASGAPALDLGAAVRAACASVDIGITDAGTCTACSSVHWSHRARADTGRQALVAWVRP